MARGGGIGTALIMAFALGVLPMALLIGVVGGGAFLATTAIMKLAAGAPLASLFTPWTVLGSMATLGAAHYTGVLQAIKEAIFGKPKIKDLSPEAPSVTWQDMCKSLNADKAKPAFEASQRQEQAARKRHSERTPAPKK